MISTAIDLSEASHVTQCDVALPFEVNIFGRYFTTLGCISGSSGRYVYVYKSGFGNIALFQVVVLMEARITESTENGGEYIYSIEVSHEYPASWYWAMGAMGMDPSLMILSIVDIKIRPPDAGCY